MLEVVLQAIIQQEAIRRATNCWGILMTHFIANSQPKFTSSQLTLGEMPGIEVGKWAAMSGR